MTRAQAVAPRQRPASYRQLGSRRQMAPWRLHGPKFCRGSHLLRQWRRRAWPTIPRQPKRRPRAFQSQQALRRFPALAPRTPPTPASRVPLARPPPRWPAPQPTPWRRTRRARSQRLPLIAPQRQRSRWRHRCGQHDLGLHPFQAQILRRAAAEAVAPGLKPRQTALRGQMCSIGLTRRYQQDRRQGPRRSCNGRPPPRPSGQVPFRRKPGPRVLEPLRYQGLRCQHSAAGRLRNRASAIALVQLRRCIFPAPLPWAVGQVAKAMFWWRKRHGRGVGRRGNQLHRP